MTRVIFIFYFNLKMSNIVVGFAIIYKWNKNRINGKLLGSPRVQRHGATSSRIHSGFHHEYN